MRLHSLALIIIAALLGSALPAHAADPVNVNAILSLTGPAAFLGSKENESLHAMEAMLNANGGIKGRPVHFVVSDDQSNPQIALQLVSTLAGQKIPAFVGTSFTATCAAITPVVEKNGPMGYCLSPSLKPAPNSFMFASAPAFDDATPVVLKYFRSRGWTKLAVIAATDATGQDSEKSFDRATTLPELKEITVVAREHFNTTDISVAAQMSRIKAAKPDLIMTYATGTSFGTLLHGISDAGIDVPVYSTGGNLTYAQMSAYAQYLPKDLFFNGAQGIVPDVNATGELKKAQTVYFEALKKAGVKPDFGTQLVWDPAMLFIEAYRHVANDPSADQLHAYMEKLKGWTGIEGTYDFSNGDNRGIHDAAVAVFRWDATKSDFVIVFSPTMKH
jgi:branched-chain amino acid transport system substrate-binding protein